MPCIFMNLISSTAGNLKSVNFKAQNYTNNSEYHLAANVFNEKIAWQRVVGIASSFPMRHMGRFAMLNW